MSEQAVPPSPPSRPPLVRRGEDRAIAGVCAAVARHLGIDAIIVRIVAIVLVFLGGVGLLGYIAGWLLIPVQEGDQIRGPGRVATVAGVLLLVAAAASWLPGMWGPYDGGLLWFAGLATVGGVLWWIARTEDRPTARRVGIALVVVGLSGLVAVASFWVAALGGGVVIAVVVIAGGLTVALAAATGRRAMAAVPILLAAAVPAAFVAAADLRLEGGIGERTYRPATLAEVADRYEMGVGELVVDLRGVEFGTGTHRMTIDLGMGDARVLVPRDVCVAGAADIGVGDAEYIDRDAGGVDVRFEDRRRARAGFGLLVVDAQIGIGAIEVDFDDGDPFDWDHHRGPFGADREQANAGCAA